MPVRLLYVGAVFAFSLPIFADGVFLKSGEIIQGKILKIDKNTIRIKTLSNDIQNINRKNELRFFMGDKDLRRKYVYDLNGNLIQGHIVDENALTYILRKNLYEADEIEIAKSEIKIISNHKIKNKKTRTAALLRSMVFPGWGQYYLGSRYQSFAMFLVNAGLIGIVAYLHYRKEAAERDYDSLVGEFPAEVFQARYEKARDAGGLFHTSLLVAALYYSVNLLDVLYVKSLPGKQERRISLSYRRTI